MNDIVRIPLDALEVGMEVVKFDKGGFQYPYYGQPLTNIKIKNNLYENGVRFAFIKQTAKEIRNVSKGTDSSNANEKADSAANSSNKPDANQNSATDKSVFKFHNTKTDFNPYITINDVMQIKQVHSKAKMIAKHVLTDARLGKAIDTDATKLAVSDLVDNCIKNPEAFMNMTRLRDFDNYTFTHSVNVSVLAIAISKRLGASATEMNQLGIAGLLHDIGKMMVPENILNKPGKYTDEEFEIMKNHPKLGFEYLSKDPAVSEDILNAVLLHHEKSDGTGYPNKLKEKSIPKFAKIIAISDVYDAITTERVYHKGMMPSEALKLLFSWSGKHFNDALVKFFISLIGIFPTGTLVILNSNELAVVLNTNKEDAMRPHVIIITDNSMNPVEPYVFNLATYNIITRVPYKSIVSAVNPKDFSIDTNSIIENFLKNNTNNANLPPHLLQER